MAGRSLHARLRRLEQGTAVTVCPACRERQGRVVLQNSREPPDGTVVPNDDRPQPCPACGAVPEQVIEIVEVVVATRDEAARWRSGAPDPEQELTGGNSRTEGMR